MKLLYCVGGQVKYLVDYQLEVETLTFILSAQVGAEGRLNWKSGFQLSVVKPKPKQLKWPITTNLNNKTNQ